MASEEESADSLLAACEAAKAKGNAAYALGDLTAADGAYRTALDAWEEALQALQQPPQLKVGELVRYDARNFFGVVMSSFTLFDEYFLKDLASDQAIWAGDPGGDLQRFARKELLRLPQGFLDVRLAVTQNLAAVCLKREEWKEVVRWADAALLISGRAPKALMRKGAALLRMNQPGPASDVLATALEVAPHDIEAARQLREAEARRSPTWVCATGCCGPWGIVCGGPVASLRPQVVAPAKRVAEVADEEEESPVEKQEPQVCPACTQEEPCVEECKRAEKGADGCPKKSKQPGLWVGAASALAAALAGAWLLGELGRFAF